MALRQLTNSDLAELLALEGETVKSPTAGKALRRASRYALSWDREARDLLKESSSLTELEGVGPYIEKKMKEWFDNVPDLPEKDSTRSDFLTRTEARAILAASPKWIKQYRGDLQMHTAWSDGSATVKEMAEEAIRRGYAYIAVTDHSKGLKIANGINEERLAKQGEEIDSLNTELTRLRKSFRVFKAIEMNINPQGKGDMDQAALESLDLVVGSFHSALRKKEDQTARYLAALENPHVHILGHPRGRIYNYRTGLFADWKKVFAKAVDLGKAIEIDSFPDRQDLNVDLLLLAKESGCFIAIDTDAHHPWQLEFAEFGLAAALKARLEPEKIINFMEIPQLLGLFSK